MAIGDRVIVSGTGGILSTGQEMVVVYAPKRLPNGDMIWDNTGTITMVVKLGGVKVGSTGSIQAAPIRVSRQDLTENIQQTAPLGGNDFVELYPIYFDDYQQTGWVPSYHIRIAGGDPSLNIPGKVY